jgi:hypothetical protein
MARLVISGVVVKLRVTKYSDDEDRPFEAGPKRCAVGAGVLQPTVSPVSSSPVRCACGLRDSRPNNHAQAAGDVARSVG